MASTPPPAASPRLPALFQLGLLIGPLLSMVDSSIVNVAVPDISTELDAALDTVQWVVSGYLLALAAALAATAFLARRLGTRRVYTASMIGFVLASVGCAFAPDVGSLIVARAVQGALGAPLMPLAMSMLLGRAGASKNLPVLASLLLFLAPALGPTIGGLLVTGWGWRWIFLINLPLGVAGLVGLLRVPKHLGAIRDPHARFDPVGLGLLAAGLALLLFGAHEGAAHGWFAWLCWTSLLAGAALVSTYLWWAHDRPSAAVDLSPVTRGQTLLAISLIALSYLVIASAIFVLPVFTQDVQGHSAFATGLAMLPQGVVTGISTVVGQKLMKHVPIRRLVGSGFAILAVCSLGFLVLEPDTPLWLTAAILAGRAAAIGLVISPLLVEVQRDLEGAQQADANTLMIIMQRVGGSLGVSLIASMLASRLAAIGPIPAFHEIGVVLAGVALVGLRLAVALRPATDAHPTQPAATPATSTGGQP